MAIIVNIMTLRSQKPSFHILYFKLHAITLIALSVAFWLAINIFRQCADCLVQFPTLNKRRRHIEVVHSPLFYSCKCGMVFSCIKYFRDHRTRAARKGEGHHHGHAGTRRKTVPELQAAVDHFRRTTSLPAGTFRIGPPPPQRANVLVTLHEPLSPSVSVFSESELMDDDSFLNFIDCGQFDQLQHYFNK